MLTDDELTERLTRRMLSAASPAGRLRLRLYVAWKRIAWRFTISFTSFVKRAIDLLASSVLLVVLSPLLLVIALLIRRDGGPVFFRQNRVGLRGKEFGMLKFRSMCVDAEAKLKELNT